MDAAIIWDEAYAEHDTGTHPEGADRVSTVVDHLRTTDLWPRLTVVAPKAGHRRGCAARAHAGPSGARARRRGRRRRLARSRHARVDAQLRSRAAVGRRRHHGHGALGAGPGAVRAHPPARPPRHAERGHGLLPVQQHRHRRGAPAAGRPRARGHRRLGCAPWQRHPGGLLRRAAPAVRLAAPVAAVPRAAASSRSAARARPWVTS